MSAARRIADGELLTTDLRPEGENEPVQVLRAVQSMQQSLRSMVRAIGEAAGKLGDSAAHLSGATQQERLAADGAGDIGRMVGPIREVTEGIENSAQSARTG